MNLGGVVFSRIFDDAVWLDSHASSDDDDGDRLEGRLRSVRPWLEAKEDTLRGGGGGGGAAGESAMEHAAEVGR